MTLRNNISFYRFLRSSEINLEYNELETNITTLLLFPFLKENNEMKYLPFKNKFIKEFYKKYIGFRNNYKENNFYYSLLSSIINLNFNHLPFEIMRKFERYQTEEQNLKKNSNFELPSINDLENIDFKKYINDHIYNESDFFDISFTMKPDANLNIKEIANLDVTQFLITHYNELYKEFQNQDEEYKKYIYQLTYHFAALQTFLNNHEPKLLNHARFNHMILYTRQQPPRENKKRLIGMGESYMEEDDDVKNESKRLKYNDDITSSKNINEHSSLLPQVSYSSRHRNPYSSSSSPPPRILLPPPLPPPRVSSQKNQLATIRNSYFNRFNDLQENTNHNTEFLQATPSPLALK